MLFAMKYRLLGRSGVEVSEIGVGAWSMGSDWGDQPVDQSIAAIHKALDCGANFIDTAAGYGEGRSEQVIAKALKQRNSEEVFVATKIHPVMPGEWPPSPYCMIEERYPEAYLEKSLEERLRNLKVEAIDLLQLHTWTRAWNENPTALEWLQKKKKEGKVRLVGVSTPEHDQNSVIDLMKFGLVDTVQVIYNLFEQEPAAELLPVAEETGTGVIVRVVLDEGSLAGRFTQDRVFAPGDFRNQYFAGDRLQRTLARVKSIEKLLEGTEYSVRECAIRFALDHPAVSTVVTGVRSATQAEQNMATSDLAPLPLELVAKLRRLNWAKGFWYSGK